jgi:glycosyltransferase involved in cell wall biosynthesis
VTRILVWHWGRHGAGPRYAAELAQALNALPEVTALLSLSAQAEILQGGTPPDCALPFRTYRGLLGGLARLACALPVARILARRLHGMRLDLAICAMPAPLDLVMARALRLAGVRFAVILHDADTHPGEYWPGQRLLQGMLARRAAAVLALSRHVADRLTALGLASPERLVITRHPPLAYGPAPSPPRAHGGKLRLLFFGRLLPYKGLDLLADAVDLLGRRDDMELRVAGSGPESEALTRLRGAGVSVENRWVPETEVGPLLAWADGLVLSHREASQSGVAAAGLAAGRWLVATRVGGIVEQLQDEPGAMLCAPNAASLAAAIRALIAIPLPVVAPADPRIAWRSVAERLLGDLQEVMAVR